MKQLYEKRVKCTDEYNYDYDKKITADEKPSLEVPTTFLKENKEHL
jgi:hypothetical protein